MDQPRWLAEAWTELGVRERTGAAANPNVVRFYRDVGQKSVRGDEVAWCAAFLGACLERAGVASTRSLMARSYASWGEAIESPRLGCIAVLSRGSDRALGHVGFVIGESSNRLMLLGGNQGDAVSVQPFEKSRLVALRWPAAIPATKTAGSSAEAELFETCLAHVLALEGGYSDDPFDPGGPTNFGVTLKVYAATRGVTLDAANTARMTAELRAIAPETVSAIYRQRYWHPCGAAAMSAPVSLMHFDASVNHGVAGAARLLQEIVGVAVDGEVGPQTLAAVAAADCDTLIRKYADARRERYRKLKHFWRFGRGWMRRVDLTLQAAGRAAHQSKSTSEGDTDMAKATDDAQPIQGKWWGQSMTIWGTVITALSTVLPALGPLIGIDISGDLVRTAGDQLVTTVQAIGGLFGTILTIYGRFRASEPLTRKPVSLRL